MNSYICGCDVAYCVIEFCSPRVSPVSCSESRKRSCGVVEIPATMRIINHQAFINLRVDLELLWPIEWNLKENYEKKDDKPVAKKGAEAKEKEPEVRSSSPKRPRDNKGRDDRRTSPR